MTTTERPAPALTPCPSWCPAGSGHPWVQEQPGNDIHGRTFVRIGGDAEAVGTAAQVALGAADAVLAAVSDPATCTEDTPAIRRVLAERAVLDAVRDWIDGDGRTTAVENAYAQLADVLAEGAP